MENHDAQNEIERRLAELETEERALQARYRLIVTAVMTLVLLGTLLFAQAQISDPGHPASQISAGAFQAGNYLVTGNMTLSNLTVLTNAVFAGNVSIGSNITFTSSPVNLRLPFKYYSCYIGGAWGTGWSYITLVDANCTGDTGIPNDNSNCFITMNYLASGTGTVYDAFCTMTQIGRYTDLNQNYGVQCDYLCW